jgi:hypothetical protein
LNNRKEFHMDKSMRSTVVSQGNFGQPPAYATMPAEDATSGVSWAAVTGGAFVIAALSTALVALGSGLGFASISPWPNSGASATTIGVAAIVWLILMQVMASAMGGYLAGRLRTRWTNIHNDEVFFRDTAHGFLSWCLAAVVTAAFLATAATVMSSAAVAGTTAGAAVDAATTTENDYYLDTMFRSNGSTPLDPFTRAEASRILVNGLGQADVPAADRDYLAKLVAARAGISEAEAQQRVSAGIAEARQAMDTARKAAAHISIWSFVALLVGAFSASYAATIGGRQRDAVVGV